MVTLIDIAQRVMLVHLDEHLAEQRALLLFANSFPASNFGPHASRKMILAARSWPVADPSATPVIGLHAVKYATRDRAINVPFTGATSGQLRSPAVTPTGR